MDNVHVIAVAIAMCDYTIVSTAIFALSPNNRPLHARPKDFIAFLLLDAASTPGAANPGLP